MGAQAEECRISIVHPMDVASWDGRCLYTKFSKAGCSSPLGLAPPNISDVLVTRYTGPMIMVSPSGRSRLKVCAASAHYIKATLLRRLCSGPVHLLWAGVPQAPQLPDHRRQSYVDTIAKDEQHNALHTFHVDPSRAREWA